MSRPRFSIIIPTRGRARTLHYAIRSCLAQEFDDYEIVVCDNCSSPETRQVVEAFASEKIVYVRSDVPLAMSDNWELAISRARGEYLTIVGDDDALLRHALKDAHRLLQLSKMPVLHWAWAFYKWPDYSLRADANRLSFAFTGEVKRVQADDLFKALLQQPDRYHELPMIYNSLIHVDLIDQLRKRTGRVFTATSPDVYSGFAFADLAGRFLSVTRPMGICGTSSQSNGQATIVGCGATSNIANEFHSFNKASGLVWNDHLPRIIKSISAVIAESYAQYRAVLHGGVQFSSAERRALSAAMMADLWKHPNLSAPERAAAVEQIREWCAADGKARTWFAATAADYARREPAGSGSPYPWQKGIGPKCFDIDASDFGVTDVDGAAALIESLLGCRSRPIAIPRRKPLTIRTIAQAVLPSAFFRSAKRTGSQRRLAS